MTRPGLPKFGGEQALVSVNWTNLSILPLLTACCSAV
jgi:hypothetical protein